MSTKQSIKAMAAARKSVKCELRRWENTIWSQQDYQDYAQSIAYRAADAAIRAWRREMKKGTP